MPKIFDPFEGGELTSAEFSERIARALAGEGYSPLPPSFADILAELQALHDKKSADYGADDDPLANIRESEKYGMPAWLGAIIRGGDKVKRIQTFAKKGKLENESVEDSIRDLAVYAIIALQLYREKGEAKK